MLETIIQVLTYIKEKKWVAGVMSYVFGFLLLVIVGFLWFLSQLQELTMGENWTVFGLAYFASVLMVVLVIKSIIQNYKAGLEAVSFFSDILTRILSVTIGFSAIIFMVQKGIKIETDHFSSINLIKDLIYNLVFVLPLLTLYPILELAASFRFCVSRNWFQKLFYFSKKYNAGMLIIVAAIFVVCGFWIIIKEATDRHPYFGELVAIILFLMALLVFLAIIFAAAYSILEKEDKKIKKIILSGLIGFVISFIAPLAVLGTEKFFDYQVDRANKILSEEGENQFGFKKIQNITFLKEAFIAQYKEKGRNYDENKKKLFSKIFDDTLENNLQSKVDAAEFASLRNNKTSSLAKDENAAVLLNYAEYDSVFYSKINTLKTRVTYEFQNTKNFDQEVIFNIRLPKSESVVTDLKLGLGLENQGIVAPRGAAEKVYEESMRRKIDPALISQVGPSTYRLRVYPVLSKTDRTTQGRQKVQFSYSTPLNSKDEIIIAPAIEVFNLSITNSTRAVVRVQNNGVLLSENQINDNHEQFFASSQLLKDKQLIIKDEKFCLNIADVENFMLTPFKFQPGEQEAGEDELLDQKKNYLASVLPNENKELAENLVFLDISKSAENQKNIRDIYKEIARVFKDQTKPFEIKLFNFAVYPTTDNFDQLEFWGYTDTGKIVEYLNENKISGKRILIVTDDTNFEFNVEENKNIDYQLLSSNEISVLQVGWQIRAQRDVLTKAVLASGGSIEIVESAQDIAKKKESMLDQKRPLPVSENCVSVENDLTEKGILEKIQVSQIGNWLLANIKNSQNWAQVATKSAELAKKYQVTNLFNSFIALETQQQKNDLDRYSKEGGRFDTVYDNLGYESRFSGSSSAVFTNPLGGSTGFSAPQGTGLPSGSVLNVASGATSWFVIALVGVIFLAIITFVVIFFIGWVAVKRKQKKEQENAGENKTEL